MPKVLQHRHNLETKESQRFISPEIKTQCLKPGELYFKLERRDRNPAPCDFNSVFLTAIWAQMCFFSVWSCCEVIILHLSHNHYFPSPWHAVISCNICVRSNRSQWTEKAPVSPWPSSALLRKFGNTLIDVSPSRYESFSSQVCHTKTPHENQVNELAEYLQSTPASWQSSNKNGKVFF